MNKQGLTDLLVQVRWLDSRKLGHQALIDYPAPPETHGGNNVRVGGIGQGDWGMFVGF